MAAHDRHRRSQAKPFLKSVDRQRKRHQLCSLRLRLKASIFALQFELGGAPSLVYFVAAIVLAMLSAFTVAAFSGAINLMNSVDGDSATEITS